MASTTSKIIKLSNEDGLPKSLTTKAVPSVQAVENKAVEPVDDGDAYDGKIIEADQEAHLERVKLILLIKRYILNFEDLNDFKRFKWDKIPTEKLKSILEEMKLIVRNSSSNGMVIESSKLAVAGVEQVLTSMGLNIEGLSQCCVNSPSWSNLVKEVALEFSPLNSASVKSQLALTTMGIGLNLYYYNQNKLLQDANKNERNDKVEAKQN